MGFEEMRFINSNFLNEPLNYLNYIDSIEKFGEKSYMFEESSKPLLRELISKSTLLYTHTTIHPVLLKMLKSDDIYYIFKNHKKLGQCLNSLFGDSLFSAGDFNSVCEYLNMTAVQALNDQFLHAFGLCVEENLNSENALNWLNIRFGIDLSGYESLEAVILDPEGWKKLLRNNTLMSCISTSQWFTNKVIDSAKITIWRTSDGKYYDNNGVQYDAVTNEVTGKTISTDALEVLKQNEMVTEDVLIKMDSAYARLQDALYWFAQNESLAILKQYEDLSRIFIADERSCQYLVDHPDTMLVNALKDSALTKQILLSTMMLEKISASQNATNVFINFVSDIQKSYDGLKSIEENISVVPTISEKLYDALPLLNQVQESLDSVNQTITDIVECQNYTNLTKGNIDTFLANPDMASLLFTNEMFTDWATENTEFANEIIKNEVIGTVLSGNAQTYPVALSNEVFMNALFNDGSLYESLWISDDTKRMIVYNSQNAMVMLGNNKEFTRRFINLHARYSDDLYPVLDDNFVNDGWMATVTNNDFLMHFMCNNLACVDLMIDSNIAMNAVYKQPYSENFETDLVYERLMNHGDVGFYKWFIQKAALSNPTYTTYESWTKYVASMTSGNVELPGFKNAVDNAPELIERLLGHSEFLLGILFDPAKIVEIRIDAYSGNGVTQYSNYLIPFTEIKDILKENQLFIGYMLYYATRLKIYWYYDEVHIGNNASYYTTNKNFMDWTNDDFISFEGYRTDSRYTALTANYQTLKEWLYTSNMFMTKYILFKLGKDLNLYHSLEEICSDDALFDELIRSDATCNMCFYSPVFMKIVCESKKNLIAMYNNYSQVQTNIAKTSNQDAMDTFTSVFNVFKTSSLLIHKDWHVSDVDDSKNGFTTTEFTKIDDRRCIIVDIENSTGTNSYGYLLDNTHEPTVTGNNTVTTILKFAKYLELKAASGGKINYVEYIPLDD